MAESGNRPAVRILQKRLTIVIALLGLLGCFVLGLVWWDSVENTTAYSTQKRSIIIMDSSVSCTFESIMSFGHEPSFRGKRVIDDYYSGVAFFPSPEVSSDFITIPIYLLILTYLATLLLIWLILMNRLARRHFKMTTSIPTQD